MNCWDVLQISADADLKTIKKQYAAKLKNTKPNEDPEGFQRLHAAYKEAMQWAKRQPPATSLEEADKQETSQRIYEPEVESTKTFAAESLSEKMSEGCLEDKDTDDQNDLSLIQQRFEHKAQNYLDDHINTESVLDIQPPAESDFFDIAVLRQRWYQNADELLNDPQRLNQLDAWQTLFDQDIFLDISLRSEFSNYLFGCIIEHILERLEKPSKTKIKHSTLIFINEKLLWTQQRSSLEYTFSDENIQLVFDYIESPYALLKRKYACKARHTGDLIMATLTKRFAAYLLDMIVAGILVVMLLGIAMLIDSKFSISFVPWVTISILMLFLVSMVMEASSTQASIGKMLMGIKVVNHQGERLSLWKSLLRQILFLVSARYAIITIIFNVFYLKSLQFTHDRTSKSMVVLR